MKALRHIYPFFFLLLLISSCTDNVDLDLDEAEKILVVEGSMTNRDTTHWVKLSYTQNVFEGNQVDYTVESAALITLFENGVLVDTMAYNPTQQQFETEVFGTTGNTYSIRIVTADGSVYFSEEEELMRGVPIDTMWSEFEEGSGFMEDAYKIYLETVEPAGLGDNYQWKTYVNGKFLAEPEHILMAPDDLVDGNLIDDWDIFFMTEEEFDEYAALGPDNDVVVVRIEQATITRPYREFVQLIQEQTNFNGNLFSPPPSEIRGNIRKEANAVIRAQGYFFTANISDKSVDVIRR